MIQANGSVNSITDQDRFTEMVELSDEVLSQVCGGAKISFSIPLQPTARFCPK